MRSRRARASNMWLAINQASLSLSIFVSFFSSSSSNRPIVAGFAL